MLVRPKLGQEVVIRYRLALRAAIQLHGQTGIIKAAGRGPGPRNHLVEVGNALVVIPCGNVSKVDRLPHQQGEYR